MKNNVRLLLFMSMLLSACILRSQTPDFIHETMNEPSTPLVLNETDLLILGGSVDSYYSFYNDNWEYAQSQRDLVLYSFIMAEIYGNRKAAYDCAFELGAFQNIPQDTALTKILLHLLEIGAFCDTLEADITEASCARQLSIWYGGIGCISPNPEKQSYYEEKFFAMKRNYARKRNPK